MAGRYIKRCSTSVVIKKMHFKTTMTYLRSLNLHAFIIVFIIIFDLLLFKQHVLELFVLIYREILFMSCCYYILLTESTNSVSFMLSAGGH